MLPNDGWFRFDAERGSEEMLVLVSMEPLSNLEGILMTEGESGAAGRKTVESYFANTSAKGINVDSDDSDSENGRSVVTVSPVEGTLVLAHRIVLKRR
jgi:hypothetical protein